MTEHAQITILLDHTCLITYCDSTDLRAMALSELLRILDEDKTFAGVPIMALLTAYDKIRYRRGDLHRLMELFTNTATVLIILPLQAADAWATAAINGPLPITDAHCVVEARNRNIPLATYAMRANVLSHLGHDLLLPLDGGEPTPQ